MHVLCDLVLCDSDRSYARSKILSAYVDLTDTDGKTIEDMLRRIPSFQALPLFVQKKILEPEFIQGMINQVEECSTVCLTLSRHPRS